MKNTVIKIKKFVGGNFWPLILFSLGTFLILWQMLLPGYVLSLDMIFTPRIRIIFDQGFFFNNLPLKYLLKFINLFLASWVIQKLILIAIFFLIGFFAYFFLPAYKKYGVAYWAGLLFLVNPFVYERFLAGHWSHLFAYALLPPFAFFLFNFYQAANFKNLFWLLFIIFLISIFSLHFFVMAVIMSVFYSLYSIIKHLLKKDFHFIKEVFLKLLVGIIVLLILTSYWTIPYLLNLNHSVISVFDQQNPEEFKTVASQHLNTTLNVLALYGYWGENRPWAKYFLWPNDHFAFWLILAFLLLILVVLGIYKSFKIRQLDKTIFFLMALIFGFIFSVGVGDTIFKDFNQWLFRNVWFWSGFRDSQKWSSFLILSYAYFGSLGVYVIIDKLRKYSQILAKYSIIVFCLVPAFYTYTIWGGFSRQLKPVWYPQSWQQANEILNQGQTDFRVLFLPWHQYFSLNFNQKLITLNPAKEFFDQEIVQGNNMEIGKIFSQGGNQINQEVEDILLSSSENSSQQIVRLLKEKKIKYIIFSHDLDELGQGQTGLKFSPQPSDYLKVIFDSPDLTLYEIVL